MVFVVACSAFCWFHQRMRSYRAKRLQVRNNAARTTFCMQYMHLHVEKSREINRCAAQPLFFLLLCVSFFVPSCSVEHLVFTRRYQRIGWKRDGSVIFPLYFYAYCILWLRLAVFFFRCCCWCGFTFNIWSQFNSLLDLNSLTLAFLFPASQCYATFTYTDQQI